MFKQLAPSVVEEMRKDGRIILTAKNGWEKLTSTNSVPYKINLQLGCQMEHLFNCYLQIYDHTIVVSNIESSPSITTQKGMVDGYLDLAIDGIIKFTRLCGKNRIIVDTDIKCAADHLPHYGFKLFSGTGYSTKSIKGILRLNE